MSELGDKAVQQRAAPSRPEQGRPRISHFPGTSGAWDGPPSQADEPEKRTQKSCHRRLDSGSI